MKRISKLYQLTGMILIVSIFLSCKKELLPQENVIPSLLELNRTYTKGGSIQTVDYAHFLSNTSKSHLGALSSIFQSKGVVESESAFQNTLSSLPIIKSNIKKIERDGHVIYVFALELPSKRSTIFRNITIDYSSSGLKAFLTTYIPSTKWLNEFRNHNDSQFDGKIIITQIDTKTGEISNISKESSTVKNRALSSVNFRSNTSSGNQKCSSTTLVYERRYLCASGNHWPEDSNCTLTGIARAGTMQIEYDVTLCYPQDEGGGGTNGDGEEETTPSVPGDYDPCDVPADPSAPGLPMTTICDDNPPPSDQQLEDILDENDFALISNLPCHRIINWLATAKFVPDQSILNQLSTLSQNTNSFLLTEAAFRIQKIDDARSPVVNMDNFSVKVNTLPTVNGHQLTAPQFLHLIRVNMDYFTDGKKVFTPYASSGVDYSQIWNSNNPKGAILALGLSLFDNGSVITSFSATDRWTFTTIHEPMYLDHPVSGNRNFGYNINTDGSYTFYTTGVDRLTNWDAIKAQDWGGIPFDSADRLWGSFQDKINYYVTSHEGSSQIISPEIYRPNWSTVKAVLNGRRPLSTLSKKCPPNVYIQQ